MSLNIKRAETHRMAEQLAALTGESLTDAVTEAIRERLERLGRMRDRDARVERVMEIAGKFQAGLTMPMTSTDHGDLLYDENGLPR